MKLELVLYLIIVEVTKNILLLNAFFGLRYSNVKNNKLILLLIISIPSFIYYFMDQGNKIVTHPFFLFVITLVVILIKFNELLSKKLLIYFISYFTTSGLDVLIYWITKNLLQVSHQRLIDDKIRVLSNTITTIIIYILVIFKNNIYPYKEKIKINTKIYFVTFFVIFSGVMVSGILLLEEKEYFKNIFIFQILYAVIGISIPFLCYILMVEYNRYRNTQLQLDMSKEHIRRQHEYYQMLLSKDESTYKFRHDYKQHLYNIKTLIMNCEYDRLSDYINSISEKEDEMMINFDTGHILVNSILWDIEKRCQKHNIMFEFSGRFTEQMRITDFDLCTILVNALINSTEAASQVIVPEKRYVKVKVETQRFIIKIEIRNSIKEKINIKNNCYIPSTKEDKDKHGYGIRNMCECIHKYQGILHYESTESMMITRILIHNTVHP